MPNTKLIAHIVTFNNEATIVRCVESLLQSEGFTLGTDFEVWITDNASGDRTAELLKEHFADSCRLTFNDDNLGFCRAHNEAARAAIDEGAGFFFVVNPDLRIRPQALLRLQKALEKDTRAGTACPKLLRADGRLNAVQPHILDAAGMYITPSIRHFDRGSQQPDRGQFDAPGYVFGGSGAALLMKRDFMLDTALVSPPEGSPFQVFDEAFFAYREDADLAWRAQWLGWKCRYVPSAVGFHQRVVLPEYRAFLPPHLNALSVRNRFLLQLNNWSWNANAHCIPAGMFRNLLVAAGACLIERSSLPALGQAWKQRKRALSQRRQLLERARVSPRAVGKWFDSSPLQLAASKMQKPAPISSLHVIVINYNSGDRLAKCVAALQRCVPSLKKRLKQVSIIVVDNDSQDGSGVRARTECGETAELSFALLGENKGFAGAINYAAGLSRADALLILNPDTVVESDALQTLLTALDSDSDLGAAAPLLKDSSGAAQSQYSCRRLPSLGSTLAELFFLHRLWPNNPWTSHYLMQDEPLFHRYVERRKPDPHTPHESLESPSIVEQPAAACLMIRGAAFRRLGGFDERFHPAWFEDVDFCTRLRSAGYLAAVASHARVEHEGGYSKEYLSPADYACVFYRNQDLYWRRHSTGLGYAAFRIPFSAALLLRAAIALLKAAAYAPQGKKKSLDQLALSASLLAAAVRLPAASSRSVRTPARIPRWKKRLQRCTIHLKHAVHLLRNPEYRVLDREPLAPSIPFEREQRRSYSSVDSAASSVSPLASAFSGHGLVIGLIPDCLTLPAAADYDSLDSGSELLAAAGANISDGSYDFVIANDCLQASADPLHTLSILQRIVRSNGVIHISLNPEVRLGHKPIEHIMSEFKQPSAERRLACYLERCVKTGEAAKESAIRRAQAQFERSEAVALHSFTADELERLITWYNQHHRPLSVELGPAGLPGDGRAHYLLRMN